MSNVAIPCLVTAVISSAATYLLLASLREQALPRPAESSKSSDQDSHVDLTDDAATRLASSIHEENKIVFVVRTDLGMTKGKIAAQCGHATLACYKRASKLDPKLVQRYERQGQPKIALKCSGGEEELEIMQAQAVSLGLVAEIIHDAGRTQIAAGSATVLGIGKICHRENILLAHGTDVVDRTWT